jgi:predicted deacylase
MTSLAVREGVVDRWSIAAGPESEVDVVDVVGPQEGPRLTVIAGIHGDEPEGPLAVMRLIDMLAPVMAGGSVRAVAIANPAAFRADRRENPIDGQNLARAFPGDSNRTPTERLAAALHEQVIKGSAFVIDLHSAGRDFAMPLYCGFRTPGAETAPQTGSAARAFGAPLAWRHTGAVPPGRTVSSAIQLGIPCLYAEAEGGQEVRGHSLDLFVSGTLRVAHQLGIVTSAPPAPPTRLLIDGGGGDLDRSLRAEVDGYLVTRCSAGDILNQGQLIAELLDDRGRTRSAIAAPARGTVMLLRRRTRVSRNDIVAFMTGEPKYWPLTP